MGRRRAAAPAHPLGATLRLPLLSRVSRRSRTMTAMARRPTAWVGVAIAALYLVAVVLARPQPGARLLYDGPVPLAPYRWVSPPPDLAEGNQPPSSGTATITLGALESMPADASTDDEQAAITVAEGTIALRSGERAATVRLVPRDPRTVGPAPRGLKFDGNAYDIVASYARSGRPVRLVKPATVVLRYPIHATVLLRARPGGWVRLRTTRFPATQQLVSATDQLGVFVAAAPAGSTAVRFWVWASLLAIAAVLSAAAIVRVRRRLRHTP